jgi:membrane protein DedA with SNARE-associated domain
MNSRNFFAYTLSALVVVITVMALLAIWDIIQWQYIQQYFGKTFKSLIIISISAVVIYIIQSLLFKKETAQQEDKNKSSSAIH